MTNQSPPPWIILPRSLIPPAPPELIALFGAPRERTRPPPPLVELDLPANVEAARAAIATVPPPSVHSRNKDTYRAACLVKDLGVSLQPGAELVRAWLQDTLTDATADAPFTWEEALRTIESAYAGGRKPPGCATPEGKELLRAAEASSMFPAVAEQAETAESRSGAAGEAAAPAAVELEARPPVAPTPWRTMASFLAAPRPSRAWVVPDWLPHGPAAPTLFTGEGGTGKSLSAMQLAAAVATGTAWLGLPVTRRMPAAMVLCEDSADEIAIRCHDLAGGIEALAAADVRFMSRAGEDAVLVREREGRTEKGPFYDYLVAELTSLGPDEKLLILDTAADIYAGDESSRTGVNTFVKHWLVGLATRANATLVLIAHPPKVAGSTYSGSTAWNNAFRNRLFLSWFDKDKRDNRRLLSREKANYSVAGASLVLEYRDGTFRALDRILVEDRAATLVLGAVKAAWAAGNPFHFGGRGAGGRRMLLGATILDDDGVAVSADVIKAVTVKLIDQGRLKNVCGQKHGNGLFVVDETDAENDQDL